MNKYCKYKNSRVEWIGVIPEQWKIIRTKFLFHPKSDKNHPDLGLLSVSQKEGVVYRDSYSTKVWNPEKVKLVSYKRIDKGDFVISLRSFEGGVELSNVQGILSPAYTVLSVTRKIVDKYYWILMKSYYFVSELNKNVTGIRQGKSIEWDNFKEIYVPLPSHFEQLRISLFLDKKMKKIDLLVNKIQKKIELLKEQRKSLISQCVTKGLDPYVEMKDSGVEWIGKIPKHWNAVKLKYLTTHNDETLSNNTDPNYKFHYLQLGDVSFLKEINLPKKISFAESPSRARRIVRNMDVAIPTVGTEQRSVALIPDKNEIVCSTGFCVLRGKRNNICQKFLFYCVQSERFIETVILNSYGVIYPSINPSALVEIEIAFPPIGEQEQISEFLDSKIEQYNKLIALETKRIELLKEYRQSLISSAVTGKIRITEDMI